jgi:hypothetical protein
MAAIIGFFLFSKFPSFPILAQVTLVCRLFVYFLQNSFAHTQFIIGLRALNKHANK